MTRPNPETSGPGDHDHSHDHGMSQFSVSYQHRGKLLLTLSITLTVMVIQLIGAIISKSNALLADTAHMFTDSLGLMLAFAATVIAARPPSAKRSYGNLRVEILAALINGLVVLVVGVSVIYRGIMAVLDPNEVVAGIMLAAACLGFVANLIGLLILQKVQQQSLNLRGAYLEVLGDMLGSLAVIIASIIIMATGWLPIDGIISILIGLLIIPRAISLLKDVIAVLLESTPKEIDPQEVRNHLESIPEVVSVHDLHIWTITSGNYSITAHLVVDEDYGDESLLLPKIQECLGEHFELPHATIQIEPEGSGIECTHAHP